MAYFKSSSRFIFGGAPQLKQWLSKLPSIHKLNSEDSELYAADNMILIGRTQGFLKEKKFTDLANKFFLNDELHSSIVWRIHILAWAIDCCKDLEGDFIEFGCYDAAVAEFLINYNNIENFNKIFFLYDIFDSPPTTEGSKHSPDLFDEVKNKMKKYDFVKVIKGLLPNSFEPNIPDNIAFVHMDLNSADTEVSLLKLFFDKIVKGGILILDDYATSAYKEQYFREKEFLNNLGHSVVELPTGQGMVIKN